MRRRPALVLAPVLVAVALVASSVARAAPRRARGASLGSPKEDLAAPLPPSAPAVFDKDAALLRAVLWAVEPAPSEIRVLAVEDLGLLGDQRALNPLAQLVFDLNPAVQQAALRAVALIRAPRAEEILSNVVRHPMLSERLKAQAARWLVYQGTATARETVTRLAGPDATVPAAVRDAAKQALDEWALPNR